VNEHDQKTRPDGVPDLSDAALRELAGSASFGRGRRITGGALSELRLSRVMACARVTGTFEYEVRLQWIAGADRLNGECSCPVGLRGSFCKHCVAVALAWRAADGRPAAPGSGAREDPADRLISAAHRAAPEPLPPTPRAMRSDVTRALGSQLRLRDHIAYDAVPEYVARVDVCIALIDAYASEQTAEETVELCERTLEKIELQLGFVDDSAGRMWPRVLALRELHRRACMAAGLDPRELAERLFTWNDLSDWETFDGFPEDYRLILGDAGWATVDRLARELDARRSGQKGSRFRLQRLRISLARVSGQVEDLVQAYGDAPSGWHDHLSLSQECEEFGRPDLARYWVRVGIEQYPDEPRLHLRMAALLNAAGDPGAAEAAQAAFAIGPSLPVFKELHALASPHDDWEDVRARALEVAGRTAPGNDLKTRILLWLGEPDAALAAYLDGGCLRSTRSQLAVALEKDRPDHAVELHLLEIEETLEVADRRRYRIAVELLERCRDALTTAGLGERFAPLVEDLRARHARRPALMQMLDDL
jgi:hypothetical protein